ncbi:MAG: HNH endonuclease [Lachnospiraceae bacterium]|nr:HNH endonuclease [Lachnospiraceae bacterium]
MAEFDYSKGAGLSGDYQLNIDQKYYNSLYIEGFSQMMSSPSYCYKFYWLEAIVTLISMDVTETTMNDIIDEMICNAWYSVCEFHIHLTRLKKNNDVDDGLERAINTLKMYSDLSSQASKDEIKAVIKKYDDKLKDNKKQLTAEVPYRALSAFFESDNPIKSDMSINRKISYIKMVNKNKKLLPYTIGESNALKREIIFNKEWIRMIQDNTVSILGWIQYEKVKWLQRNNPEVPGLIYKLKPLDKNIRNLEKVKVLWKEVLKIEPMIDIFTDISMTEEKYDIDHFIPKSFVVNDELWNLMPVDSSLNSSKNNKLPEWDKYFIKFAKNQYKLYNQITNKEKIKELYIDCFKDNLYSIWAVNELYKEGNGEEKFYRILEENMYPVYKSARRQGYTVWYW